MAGFNKFPAISRAFPSLFHEMVRNTAQGIITDYYDLAPEDTGFMASSGYVVTNDSSTYGATTLEPPGDSYLLPEVVAPDDPYTAIAAIAANYAIYQEYGTRFMPAQPTFFPAVDAAKALFQSELSLIEPKLKGTIG